VTTVRSVADIRRVFVYNALNAVAVRGTGQQMSLAAWLVDQLNQPAHTAAPAPHEYKLPGDDGARVFELTYPQTPQQLQEIVTILRSIGDIRRLFVCNERRAVAPEDSTAPHEYRLSSGADDLVRVFYLASSQSAQDLQKVAVQVRTTARIPRLFIYNALGALAVRGTLGQVTTAEKVIEEMKAGRPIPPST
jgi:hypothetical protein